jgi:hypothetical protein
VSSFASDQVPEQQEGDLSREIIYTGFGRPVGAIFRQAEGESGRTLRAEHRSGRWMRFEGYNAAMTWIGQAERGDVPCDGETEPWVEEVF